MNTQNVWVKRSEREPCASEFPVIYGNHHDGGWDFGLYLNGACVPELRTHWRSIKCDPPAQKLTQRDVDGNNAVAIYATYRHSPMERMIREAVYAERREVAKLLTEYFGGDCWRDENKVPDMRDIAARLDEQGAK